MMTERERAVLKEASAIVERIYDSASLIVDHEEDAVVRKHVQTARTISGQTLDGLYYLHSWGGR
jgi:hypothetical protein